MNRLSILKGKLRPVNKLFPKSKYLTSSTKNENDDCKTVAAENDKKEDKTESSTDKLNKLLLQLANNNTTVKLDLAKPSARRKRNDVPKEKPPEAEPIFEKRLEFAAKTIAKEMGSDGARVESELLSKLLSSKTATTNLSVIVKDMKIERDSKSSEQMSRAQQVKQLLNMANRSEAATKTVHKKSERRKTRSPLQGNIEKLDVFGFEPLGLFRDDLKDQGIINNKWRTLHKKDLQLAVTHPPANYFQQMIQWTETGKIWKFPIDNEQGMEQEKNVYFTEHVFLEKYLEPWCPPKGPVRHFMELVCVGLSKNPYMTVETKREHIEWYQKYFEEKIQLLKDVGAIPSQSQSETVNISDK